MIPISFLYCKSSQTPCDVELYDQSSYSVTLFRLIIKSNNDNTLYDGYQWYYSEVPPAVIGHENQPQGGLRSMRLGLYRIEFLLNNVLKKFVYYDNRDCNFIMGSCSGGCNSNDITLRYDVGENKLHFNNKWATINFQDLNWFENISNGYYINWSTIKSCTTICLDGFPFEESLTAIEKKNTSTGVYEPHISWFPETKFQPDGYKIYYRLSGSGNFSLLNSVSSSTFEYTHTGLAVGNSYYLDYKVEAYNNGNSNMTNIASIGVEGYYKESNSSVIPENISLYQNYPNPFNPVTEIKFSIAVNTFLTLSVYNILGEKVAELFNGYKDAGTHLVSFDGSMLPSGIYIYKIVTNEKILVNKMVLAK